MYIATNIPVLLMTAFVLQSHIYVCVYGLWRRLSDGFFQGCKIHFTWLLYINIILANLYFTHLQFKLYTCSFTYNKTKFTVLFISIF